MMDGCRSLFFRRAGKSGFFAAGLFVSLLLSGLGIVAAPSLAIQVISAQPTFDQRTHEPIILLKMSEASAKPLAEITSRNLGRKLEILIDGHQVLRSVIREPILGGSLQISDRFSEQEANDIAARLNTAASKLEFVIVD